MTGETVKTIPGRTKLEVVITEFVREKKIRKSPVREKKKRRDPFDEQQQKKTSRKPSPVGK